MKNKLLDNWAFYVSYRSYGFQENSWTPQDGLKGFIEELKEEKCIYVKGRYGQLYYVNPPTKKGAVKGTPVFGWAKGAEKRDFRSSHSIVVVGASPNGVVYFVDPLDGSSPKDPTQQKVYAMSYRTFQNGLFNLKSMQRFDLSDRYCLVFHPETENTEEKKQ